MLGGCNPYPELPPLSTRTETNVAVAPDKSTALGTAILYAQEYRKDVEKLRNTRSFTRNATGALLFGGVVATGAAVAYDATRDLIVGLGLGTGSVYGAGTLYNPQVLERLYSRAATTVACVENAAFEAYAAGNSVRARKAQLEESLGSLDAKRQEIEGAISRLTTELPSIEAALQKWNTLYPNEDSLDPLDEYKKNLKTLMDNLGSAREKYKDSYPGVLPQIENFSELVKVSQGRVGWLEDVQKRKPELKKFVSDTKKFIAKASGLPEPTADARRAAEAAIAAAEAYQTGEDQFAANVIVKIRAIDREVSEQIAASQPDLDAVIGAAQGVGATGLGAGNALAQQSEAALRAMQSAAPPSPPQTVAEMPALPGEAPEMEGLASVSPEGEGLVSVPQDLAVLFGKVKKLDAEIAKVATTAESLFRKISTSRNTIEGYNAKLASLMNDATALTKTLQEQTRNLVQAVTGAGDNAALKKALEQCNLTLTDLAAQPLTVAPGNTVELAKKKPYTITVSGGEGLIVPRWLGEAPAMIRIESFPGGKNRHVIRLTADGDFKKAYTLQIGDQAGASIQVSVCMSGGSPCVQPAG